MSETEAKKLLEPDGAWLESENPELFHILRALEGDAEAQQWLEMESPALGLFTHALRGDKKALKTFQEGAVPNLDDLFATFDSCDPVPWLCEKHPELHLVFTAAKGDEAALRRLKRKKAALARLAEALRKPYQAARNQDGAPGPETGGGEMADGAAADVGCLVGELHLRKGDFDKAVEAFTRAINTNPSADEYEGRARAYRALALLDERKAEELRNGDAGQG